MFRKIFSNFIKFDSKSKLKQRAKHQMETNKNLKFKKYSKT